MTLAQSVLLAFGGNAVLLIVLAWLARSLVGQLLTKDVERFKTELAAASIAAAERLKHELQLVAQEHQVVLSKLHERRAQVVADAYGLLVEANWAARDFVSPTAVLTNLEMREKYAAAMNKATEFYRYFDKNRIYLPLQLCARLEQFLGDMRGSFIDFGVYVSIDEAQLPDDAIHDKHQAWIKAAQYFEAEVPRARAALEDELRSSIGAASRTSTTS